MFFFLFFLVAGDSQPIYVGERFSLHSEVMAEERTVLVYLPSSYYVGNASYPVMYMTDGDGHFHHTGGTIDFLASNNRIPEMIVVGVTNTQRTRDLTPLPVAENNPNSGGADKFLEFFTDELIPYVEKKYRTKPFRILNGHSFGGIFVINALFNQPDSFQAYIAVSPSLWWGNQALIRRAQTFFEKEVLLNKSFYMTLGNEGERMLLPFKAFEKRLKKNNLKEFRWDSRVIEDEDHGSVVLRSQYHALKFIFDGWLPPQTATQNLGDLERHFQTLSKRVGYDVPVPEQMVNMMGYNHLRTDIRKAISIFEWNVEHYPQSANAYDSLGEAFENLGNLEKAAQNYKIAVELGKKNSDPNIGIYQTNLERVVKGTSQ